MVRPVTRRAAEGSSGAHQRDTSRGIFATFFVLTSLALLAYIVFSMMDTLMIFYLLKELAMCFVYLAREIAHLFYNGDNHVGKLPESMANQSIY